MTSITQICNRALASIGTRSTIASIDEDSPEAQNCKLIFEDTRDEILSMAPWNFARKTGTGTLIKSAPGTPTNTSSAAGPWTSAQPAPPWLFEYAYPSDCIQVRMLQPQANLGWASGVPIFTQGGDYMSYGGAQLPPIPFLCAIDQNDQGNDINVVLTNQYQAIFVYTRRVTDVNIWSGQAVQALVAAMAAKLAQPLTGEKSLANQKFTEANGWIIQARASDGNEGLTVINNMPDWITIRDDWAGTYGAYYAAPFGPLYSV